MCTGTVLSQSKLLSVEDRDGAIPRQTERTSGVILLGNRNMGHVTERRRAIRLDR